MTQESKYITRDSEGGAYFRHEVGGYTYEFTLRDVPEEKQQWLSEVVSAQLSSVHFRAEMNTTKKFQTAFRKLGGF